ncbi:MAG TPA: glycerophosphodiester phosphodiesterase [Vicinamibacterales bacterium]|nr:glycerophosphodiester phosphodiesterase [Vicinamibacterales bacterium]
MSPRPHPALALGRPQVFAHRGGSALRPENTLAAFDHGLALGADGLELDVHLSRDGIVVVHHDAMLDRTTDGHGPLAALTADELARLDTGFHFTPASRRGTFPFRGQGIGVPALRDVLRRYAQAWFIIELKQNDPALARRTVDELRAAGAVERAAVGSFGTRVLRAVRASEPRLVTGASREETRWALYASWCRWRVRHPPYDAFQVPERAGGTRVVSERFVDYAHRNGVAVQVWTVDEEADMRRLLEWGVDAIISDRPDVAVRVVKSFRNGAG